MFIVLFVFLLSLLLFLKTFPSDELLGKHPFLLSGTFSILDAQKMFFPMILLGL